MVLKNVFKKKTFLLKIYERSYNIAFNQNESDFYFSYWKARRECPALETAA